MAEVLFQLRSLEVFEERLKYSDFLAWLSIGKNGSKFSVWRIPVAKFSFLRSGVLAFLVQVPNFSALRSVVPKVSNSKFRDLASLVISSSGSKFPI